MNQGVIRVERGLCGGLFEAIRAGRRSVIENPILEVNLEVD